MLAKNKYKRSGKKGSYKISWNGLPATVRQSLFEVTLTESFFASIFWHIIGLLLIWIISFCIIFFGLAPKIFPIPKTKVQDIEFNIGGGSSHRARHRTRTTTIESMNENFSVSQTTQNNNTTTSSKTTKDSNKKTAVIPEFSMPISGLKSISSGLGGSKKGGNNISGGSSGGDNSMDDINGAFASNGGSSAGSGANGFNRNATKKIITSYDISPYVNELKRNIRWNWKAPEGSENKRVELFLRIAKDGRLIILNVKKTSEAGSVDNAALNAVKKCLPLNPLPSKYTKGYLDVIFTFSSNSVGSRY